MGRSPLYPATGFGQSAWELFVGRSFVSGRKLDWTERTVSAVGVISLGTSSSIKGILKIERGLAHVIKYDGLVSKAIKEAKSLLKVGNSAGHGAKDVLQVSKLKAGYAVQEIRGAKVIGSALKEDVTHRSASFMLDTAAKEGRTFTIRGGDGIQRNLLQVKGSLNGEIGIFEWITGPKNTLVHQRFIKSGKITGVPNQNPMRLPNHE